MPIESTEVQSVLNRHWRAFAAGDLELEFRVSSRDGTLTLWEQQTLRFAICTFRGPGWGLIVCKRYAPCQP